MAIDRTPSSSAGPNTFMLNVDMTATNIQQSAFQNNREKFITHFANSLGISALIVTMISPVDTGGSGRRALATVGVTLEVGQSSTNGAMALSNQLNDPDWLTRFQTLLRQEVGFENIFIQMEQSEVERSSCTTQPNAAIFGDAFQGINGPVVTMENSVNDCIFMCVSYANCVAYTYKTDQQCTLLSAVRTDVPFTIDLNIQFSGHCAKVGITAPPTTSTTAKTASTATPTTDADNDARENVSGGGDDDSDDSKRAVVIILVAIILIIVVGIMVYCAYHYGKNKKLEHAAQIRQLEEFEIRPPVQYVSRPVHSIQQKPVVHEVVYEQRRQPEMSRPAMSTPSTLSQPNMGGASVEGPRFTTGLEYLAAQPQIPVVTNTVEKPPLPARDIETIGAM
jgi:hypothetical protein